MLLSLHSSCTHADPVMPYMFLLVPRYARLHGLLAVHGVSVNPTMSNVVDALGYVFPVARKVPTFHVPMIVALSGVCPV